ncbi:MAG TPA: ATP-binding cassette domain-containing protein [Candidatus Methylomirabilis sp.]|nr:ATP-binding cassette domain-containing protein [Candidatus Methylomirabilis sp.]
MPIIETKKLTKKYRDLVAVNNLNLRINEGEIFGLLGPNGAGKTTTLMMLTTLIPPTSGTAVVNGFDIVKQKDKVRASIGMVFQDPSSDDTLTGYENLKLHGMLYNIPPVEREKRIKEVLKLVELTDRKDELVKNYSGGMRRRLELGRGLMHYPKVLFLDEPTLGLDPQTRDHLWRYISELARRMHISVIITTHYMEEADMLCDRVAIIDAGKIVALDAPSKLKEIIGGDVVTIKSKEPKLDSIKQLSFISKVDVKKEIVSLTVANASTHLAEILATIGQVDSVEVHTPTLSDVFLHYTGREIREDTPEGGWANRVMSFRSKK